MKKIFLLVNLIFLGLLTLGSCSPKDDIGELDIADFGLVTNVYTDFEYDKTIYVNKENKEVEEGMASFAYKFYKYKDVVSSIVYQDVLTEYAPGYSRDITYYMGSFYMISALDIALSVLDRENELISKYNTVKPVENTFLYNWTLANTKSWADNSCGPKEEKIMMTYTNKYDQTILYALGTINVSYFYLVEMYSVDHENKLTEMQLSYAYKQLPWSPYNEEIEYGYIDGEMVLLTKIIGKLI